MALKQQTIDSLLKIANGRRINYLPSSFAEINGVLIHCRFKSNDKIGSSRYPFNINQATLRAKYELWVCDMSCYYLIPIDIIKGMYNDPDAYINKTPGQESMRTITAHADTNIVDFGRNGKKMSIRQFQNVTI